MSKTKKSIKQIEKQIKKLTVRIDDMSIQLTSLRNITGTTGTEQIAAELQEESEQVSKPDLRFGEEEVEKAAELAEDAEEITDIIEKQKIGKKKGKKGKKKK